MGAIYYQNYGDNSIRGDVLQIISDIKNQYSDMIINPYWIDDMTKKKAIEKLESLKYFIECPKEFLNNSIIDKFYGRLKFLDVLPPVYQNVLFKKNNLNSVNYGIIGRLIGHEIGHTFDKEGIYYDANGIRNNWWRNDSIKNFDDRAMCIVEQYGNNTMPEINANVNGRLTLRENIADNSGLKAAYRAYIIKLKSSSNNGERLTHLSYNSKQLFWISYANRWCEKVTVEDSKRDILDSHASSEFRVIGLLSNMKEFSIDFQCPIGSKMNPIKKCK
ncbi:hypothetical protein HCN44_006053 [Aphidius gifuensis]|uniref:Uncharacterized protein n=1 Tax=Aphidius gifuensis TaxID=684658 RepID=A0A834Y475_APHGI|nr:hypothetical protein HCN44_006053 [Aphidius gifuensis]